MNSFLQNKCNNHISTYVLTVRAHKVLHLHCNHYTACNMCTDVYLYVNKSSASDVKIKKIPANVGKE